jgi:hypothetical protein
MLNHKMIKPTMKTALKFFLAMISASIISSCTKELDLSFENLNQSRKVSITIRQNFHHSAWLEVYPSFTDFRDRINPIYSGSFRSTIILDNLEEGLHYLRLNYREGFNTRSYYYNEAIIVPAHNCEIVFYTRENKWIRE